MPDIELSVLLLLGLALLAACVFEFINGFHDTANAVATVIYTKSLGPTQAVILSGVFNFIGVITGGLGVGLSIINLLPIDLVIDLNVYHTIAMVMSILISAILWNFGTWYFGLPSSSSHTLIGSILGVGIGFAFLPTNDTGLAALNWDKVIKVFSGLLMAPVIGFSLAMLLMYIIKNVVNKKRRDELFEEPKKDSKPPKWIKWTLISTCTLVSFAHGRNDGQKGIGLIMLILIGVLPSYFATHSEKSLSNLQPEIAEISQLVEKANFDQQNPESFKLVQSLNEELIFLNTTVSSNSESHKPSIRRTILQISNNTKQLLEINKNSLSEQQKSRLKELAVNEESGIRKAIDYAPFWVILMVSLSLGFGTMFGWKRIVVTIGEKIGKSHLTYAQGASAELVAAATIGLASGLGMPVSTTHTLSSGIAGTMVASKGLGNLQKSTIRNILIAWVLTLPVSMFISGSLFLIFRSFMN
ncbi:inorganic phosphate transporter, PiT family [Spirosomataceae bacterium TFI 002]|nr:inorganic phosphate transporter, PiT family [Spirosomataceae bacterium TFI 002]